MHHCEVCGRLSFLLPRRCCLLAAGPRSPAWPASGQPSPRPVPGHALALSTSAATRPSARSAQTTPPFANDGLAGRLARRLGRCRRAPRAGRPGPPQHSDYGHARHRQDDDRLPDCGGDGLCARGRERAGEEGGEPNAVNGCRERGKGRGAEDCRAQCGQLRAVPALPGVVVLIMYTMVLADACSGARDPPPGRAHQKDGWLGGGPRSPTMCSPFLFFSLYLSPPTSPAQSLHCGRDDAMDSLIIEEDKVSGYCAAVGRHSALRI